MDPAAAAELSRLGGDPSGFQARQVTRHDCDDADLVLTTTADQRACVLQESPRALRRTFTLMEFAHLLAEVEPLRRHYGNPAALVEAASAARGASSLTTYDVPDPFDQPAEFHRSVAATIEEAVATIAFALSGSRSLPD